MYNKLMQESKLELVIGLGNPGQEYENTYHNVGYLFVDFLKYQLSEVPFKLLKTTCYMNLSGEFVRKNLRDKSKTNTLLIIHDDSDQLLGHYKITSTGSSGGHNGIQNIIDQIKTENFYRLKIGIRNPEESVRKKASDFVLNKISLGDQAVLANVFEKALEDIKKQFNF